jgi:hypothetical protein
MVWGSGLTNQNVAGTVNQNAALCTPNKHKDWATPLKRWLKSSDHVTSQTPSLGTPLPTLNSRAHFSHFTLFYLNKISSLSLSVEFILWLHSVAGGLGQTQRGHQRFQEASLLRRLAETQGTRVQRLSPGNKGGFPYVPFIAVCRNWWGGRGTACPIYDHVSKSIILI